MPHAKVVNTKKKPAIAVRKPSNVHGGPAGGTMTVVSGELMNTDAIHNKSDPDITRCLFLAQSPTTRGTDNASRMYGIPKNADPE